MNRMFIVLAVLLAACCPQVQQEGEQSMPAYFVGQTLSPIIPSYLWSTSGSAGVCRLWGKDAEVRVAFVFPLRKDQALVEVAKSGTLPIAEVSPTVTIQPSVGIRGCKKGEVLLLLPTNRLDFQKSHGSA